MNVEIFLQVKGTDEFFAVLVKQEPLHKLLGLHLRSFSASLDDFLLGEVRDHASYFALLLDFLMDFHTL